MVAHKDECIIIRIVFCSLKFYHLGKIGAFTSDYISNGEQDRAIPKLLDYIALIPQPHCSSSTLLEYCSIQGYNEHDSISKPSYTEYILYI